MASEHGIGQRIAIVVELVLVGFAWSWISRFAASLVGLHAAGALSGGDYLAWALVAVPAGTLLLVGVARVFGRPLASLGLAPPPGGWPRALLVGLAWGAGLYGLSSATTWLGAQLGHQPEHGLFSIESRASLLAWIAGGLLAGAFGEELLFRGWLLGRVERLLRGLVPERWCSATGVVVAALVFGAGHDYQGAIAVVTVTLLGLGLGLAFLRSGRSLVVPVIAHGVLDVVGLTELYLAR